MKSADSAIANFMSTSSGYFPRKQETFLIVVQSTKYEIGAEKRLTCVEASGVSLLHPHRRC